MKGCDRCLTLVVLCALVGLSGCVSRGDYDALQQVVDNQARVIRNLDSFNRDLQLKYDRAVSDDPLKVEERNQMLAELDIWKERADRLERELKKRFDRGGVFPEPGITVEKWGIRVASAVLFDSGRHTLKASGKRALKKVSSSLRGLKIRIEGHTDSDPVRVSRDRYPYGNLQLSGVRALEVANFLIKECGLQADNISFAGYGEYASIVPNDSKANKAKNRRVDIRALDIVEDSPDP